MNDRHNSQQTRRSEFSLRGYRDLMTALIGRGYSVRGFVDAEPDKRHLIVRHDIDMSLDSAAALAEVEQELDVRSIYFVLLRSGLYNPFSAAGIARLKQILAAGHEVGLHFDASLYPEDRASLESACQRECERLEEQLGCAVEVVSFHRPTELLIGAEGLFAGRTHAYEPRFISEMGYCADSRGDWHHGHPLEHDAIASHRALQLLTHPIWWDAQPGESVVARLDRLVVENMEAYRSELSENCEPYRTAIRSRS